MAALALSSCRSDPPPKIEVCIHDEFGGAACTEADGSHVYKVPSQLNDYWCTNGSDEANFVGWAYGTSASVVKPSLKRVRKEAIRGAYRD